MSQGSNMFLVNDLSEVISADLVELGDHVIHDLFMVCGSRSEFSKVAPHKTIVRLIYLYNEM